MELNIATVVGVMGLAVSTFMVVWSIGLAIREVDAKELEVPGVVLVSCAFGLFVTIVVWPLVGWRSTWPTTVFFCGTICSMVACRTVWLIRRREIHLPPIWVSQMKYAGVTCVVTLIGWLGLFIWTLTMPPPAD